MGKAAGVLTGGLEIDQEGWILCSIRQKRAGAPIATSPLHRSKALSLKTLRLAMVMPLVRVIGQTSHWGPCACRLESRLSGSPPAMPPEAVVLACLGRGFLDA